HGAIAVNYVSALGSQRNAEGLWVTRVRDEETGAERSVRARVLINATGPYVDENNAAAREATRHRHVFSKGVHLIVDRITPHTRVLTFFADDGRLFFVI